MTAHADRAALDTNVLVYAIDVKAGEKHVRARHILRRLAGTGTLIALQALAEFYTTTTRKSIALEPFAAARVADWRQLFSVVWADADALTGAIEGAARYRLSFWDAMMWSTIRAAGATMLITEDMQDGAVIGSVTIRNPFVGKSLPVEVAALFRKS